MKAAARRGIIPFFINHRGCPHICVFCNQHRIAGAPQALDQDYMVAEIQSYLDSQKGEMDWEVAFYGGSFTALPRSLQESLLAPVTALWKEGKLAGIRCSTRPDYLDEETINFLWDRGLRTVELGVQSMDEDILERAQRGHGTDDVVGAVQRLRAKGMTVGIQLLPGLPGESWQTIVRTTVAVGRLRPDLLRIYPALVIEDTALADDYRAGRYEPLDLDTAVAYASFMQMYLEARGATVIRVGLQATEELDSGTGLVAGPYDPAMGERVRNEEWRQKLSYILHTHAEAFGGLSQVEIVYPPALCSQLRGVKKRNVNYFAQAYGDVAWTWREDKEAGAVRALVDGYTYVI